MSDFISFRRHTCTLHCLHREKYLEPVTTTAQLNTAQRNGHAKEEEKKGDRCRLLLSVFHC